MSRLRAIKSKNDRKRSRFKQTSSSQKSTPTASDSSSSSVPLIIDLDRNQIDSRNDARIDTVRRNQNKLFDEQRTLYLKQSSVLERSAWQPVINELSRRSISRTSSTRSKQQFRTRRGFLKPPGDLNPRNLFAKKQSSNLQNDVRIDFRNRMCHRHSGHNRMNHDCMSNLLNRGNENMLPNRIQSNGQASQLNQLKATNQNGHSNVEPTDRQSSSGENDRPPICFSSTFSSSNDDSSTDKNQDLNSNLPRWTEKNEHLPNESQPYSMNAIYDFEVPNFETNQFEKIRVKLIDPNERCPKDGELCFGDDLHSTDHRHLDSTNNGYLSTSDSSNNEIYGLCTSSRTISNKTNSNSGFIDLSSEHSEANASLNSGDQYRKSITNQTVDCRMRLDRALRRECLDKFIDATNTSVKTNYEPDEIESTYGGDHRTRIPQMVISKSIQLTSELESDYADRSIINNKLLNDPLSRTKQRLMRSTTNDELIKSRCAGHHQTNNLNNKLESKQRPETNSRSKANRTHVGLCRTSEKQLDRESDPVNRLLELFEPLANEQPTKREDVELDRMFNSHRSFPTISNYHQASELHHHANHRLPNHSQPTFNKHNHGHQNAGAQRGQATKSTQPQHTQFATAAKHNQNKTNQFNHANQSTNIDHHQLLLFRRAQRTGKDNRNQSITMSPVQTIQPNLELPQQPPQLHTAVDKAIVKPQKSNLFLHPCTLPANLQPNANVAFYKPETEKQSHFLVTFKHYYPEKSNWAFILLTCMYQQQKNINNSYTTNVLVQKKV